MEKKLVVGSMAQDLSAMVANGGDLIHIPKHDEISASDDEISFIPLDEQLKLHAKKADSYGEKIISLVS